MHSNKNIESLSDKEPDVAEKSEAPNASDVSMNLDKEIVLSLDKTGDGDASSKFVDELEKTVQQGSSSHFPLVIQGRQDAPEGGRGCCFQTLWLQSDIQN